MAILDGSVPVRDLGQLSGTPIAFPASAGRIHPYVVTEMQYDITMIPLPENCPRFIGSYRH